MSSLEAFDRLVGCLGRLPGVGRRSAERMAARLARDPVGLLDPLAAALRDCRQAVRSCSQCGSLTAAGDEPCRLCTDPGREDGSLCVVEDPADIALVEKSASFRGRYHALMGKLSPVKGDGPRDLHIQALLRRIDSGRVREVILALSTDVEGDATAAFLADLLKSRSVRVSRLAFGLPAGSGLSYSDPVTIARAMRGRQPAG